MIIYQLKPSVVIKIEKEVLKIFSSNALCEEEFKRLNKINTPLVSKDHLNEYEMSVVRVIQQFNKILVMEPANGIALSKEDKLEDLVKIVGQYLALFHKNSYLIDGINSSRIFGDFSIDHIFLDTKEKIISIIDPGANFLEIGDQLEDIVRFLFSVTETFRYRPYKASKVMKNFLYGYKSNRDIDMIFLKETLSKRKKISLKKYMLQKSNLKALIGYLMLNYNRLLIWLSIRC